MKLLENTKFDAITSALTAHSVDCCLEVRLESYSCKMVGQDKRLFKDILLADGPGTSGNDLQALSPPVHDNVWGFVGVGGHSPQFANSDNGLPVLLDTISRKTLFHLVATLNASFPDYSFSDAKGEHFSRAVSLESVSSTVDTQLGAIVKSYHLLKTQMWASINDEIRLCDCSVYTYHPDYLSDPFSEDGCIWSFNYFFFNKKLNRLVFFSCRALSKQAPTSQEESDTRWAMEVQ